MWKPTATVCLRSRTRLSNPRDVVHSQTRMNFDQMRMKFWLLQRLSRIRLRGNPNGWYLSAHFYCSRFDCNVYIFARLNVENESFVRYTPLRTLFRRRMVLIFAFAKIVLSLASLSEKETSEFHTVVDKPRNARCGLSWFRRRFMLTHKVAEYFLAIRVTGVISFWEPYPWHSRSNGMNLQGCGVLTLHGNSEHAHSYHAVRSNGLRGPARWLIQRGIYCVCTIHGYLRTGTVGEFSR